MTQRSNQRYTRWYERRGSDRNERRKEEYARNPDVRKANNKRSREWRANRAAGVAVTREIFRVVDGKRIRVYSLGQVSDQTGVPISTLRLLVTTGVLPEPSQPGIHRYYTGAEVKSIKAVLKKRG